MTNSIPFTFENHTIHSVIDGAGDPWFVLADVCDAMEIKNNRDVARSLDDEERADVDVSTTGAKSP